MTHAEEIMNAVASLTKKGHTEFRRVDVRDELDIPSHKWNASYNPTFQGMRIDQPGGAPEVGSKFKGVFRRVNHGIYVLTEYGKKLIQNYDCRLYISAKGEAV